MRTLRFLAVMCCLMMMVSFSAPLSNRFCRFVEKVERNCGEWDNEDWEKSQKEYLGLLDDFHDQIDSMSNEEVREIYKYIGKYKGLRLKHVMNMAEDKVDEMKETLPSLLEGFMSVFKAE